MNKEKFLSELRMKLSKLPKSELDNAINYYIEYFEDANISDDVDVTLEFGAPSQIASEILAEYATKSTIDENKDGKKSRRNPVSSIWFIILAIFAAPIGVPLAFAAVVTIAALLFAGVMVVFAFGITAVAFALSGIFMFGGALTILFKEFSTALLVGGLGLIFTGVGALVAVGIVYLFNGLIKLIVNVSKRFLAKSSKKVNGV